jgi:hypothetical protein
MKFVETDTFFVELSDDFIVTLRVKENAVVSINSFMEIRKKVDELTNSAIHSTIIEAIGFFTLEQGVRDYVVKGDYLKSVKAIAFVTDKLPHKIMANFFIKINKPKSKSKVFTKREEALKWLKDNS